MGIQRGVAIIPFDLVEGLSTPIIGLDIKRHSDTINRTQPPTILIKRPTDTCPGKFYTYIATDDCGNDRVRI